MAGVAPVDSIPCLGVSERADAHPLVARVRGDLGTAGVLSVPVWREFFRSLRGLADADLLAIVEALEGSCAARARQFPWSAPPAR